LRQLNDGGAPTARLTCADAGAQADALPEPEASELDIEALSSVARSVTPQATRRVRLSRRERKAEKMRLRDEAVRIKKEAREARRRTAAGDVSGSPGTLTRRRARSIQRRLKERDRELSKKSKRKRDVRRRAKDITGIIGYERMFKDGLCEVEEGLYSESVVFDDISYQSAREETQKGVFSAMCQLYDSFGAESMVQLTVINRRLTSEEIAEKRFFDEGTQPTGELRRYAREFNRILSEKMREGVSNISRSRYLTYTTGAENPERAWPLLARIRGDVTSTLAKIGCRAEKLDGAARLEVIQSQIDPAARFCFDYDRDIFLASPLTTKDFIAPMTLDFKPFGSSSCFVTGGIFAQVLVMRRFGSELSDSALSSIVDLPIPLNATIHVQGMDKAKAVSFVKQRAAWIDKEIIEEQRRAVNKGYDFSILPSELTYSKEETADVLDHLQNKNQRLFYFTGLIYTWADSLEQLEEQVLQIISVARRSSIEIDTLDYRQREGLNSVIPVGHNHVDIHRMFTTAQVAIFSPFATMEIQQEGGTYYGQNKESNNLVTVNRKRLSSPMGFFAGKTGAGKSFAVKQEVMGTVLNNPKDQIIILDRAGEYTMICEVAGGRNITISVDSQTHMNPFDLSDVSHMTREAQIAFKVDAVLAQASASAAESGQALDEADQSIITRCVELAFIEAKEAHPNGVPTLGDFHRILMAQDEPAARFIALRYERYVKGSMSFFNNLSTTDLSSRVTDINFKELPDAMVVFALITACEAVRNRMYANFERGVRTWLYIEEVQSLFRFPTVLAYFSRFANAGRKFGLLLTGITQSSTAMLEHETARNIVLAADFIYLLRQSALDRPLWVDLMGLSDAERGYIEESVDAGDALLIAQGAKIGIRGRFPKDTSLYRLFDTDPNAAEEKRRTGQLEENARPGGQVTDDGTH
jgi:hypothetical protein